MGIATAANHKFEDAQRKCKVVEGDLERIIERAEEFEGKARDIETQVREQEGKVRKPKLSLSKTLKKKTNTKPKLADFKKSSNWLIPVLNSPKDPLTSSNQPLMVFSNLS